MKRAEAQARIAHATLYGIVDFGYIAPADVETTARALISGGVEILQLRAKGAPLEAVATAARAILPLCQAAGIPFILNDYPELARSLGADGVHIGQDDGSISATREIVGPELLIGRSTHSLPQAQQALADGADYIGFGPLFPTPTKAGRPAIGLGEISKMEALVGAQIPAFCIGGIKPANLRGILTAGARRAVIVSHLLTAADPAAEAKNIRKIFSENPVP